MVIYLDSLVVVFLWADAWLQRTGENMFSVNANCLDTVFFFWAESGFQQTKTKTNKHTHKFSVILIMFKLLLLLLLYVIWAESWLQQTEKKTNKQNRFSGMLILF